MSSETRLDTTTEAPASRICTKCGQSKPLLSAFYVVKPRPKQSRGGYTSQCKHCLVEDRKRYNKANAPRIRLANFRYRYGIDLGSVEAATPPEGHNCPICEVVDPGPQGWCLDHCHTANRVRGWLCARCNLDVEVHEKRGHLRERFDAYLNAYAH
jgi:hypothetical protein